MNKEYMDIDGHIIVEDENGVKKPVEYRDNLDEVLIRENIIELMRIKKRELQESLIHNNKSIRTSKAFIPFPFLIFTFLPAIVITAFNSLGITNG